MWHCGVVRPSQPVSPSLCCLCRYAGRFMSLLRRMNPRCVRVCAQPRRSAYTHTHTHLLNTHTACHTPLCSGMFLTQSDLDDAEQLLNQYKSGQLPEGVTDKDLWHARDGAPEAVLRCQLP